MKRRSKLSIQVYRAITVTAIGLMIGAAPMRVMTVQAQEIEKNQKQQSDYQKLDYKVFEDSSERLLEWSDIYMLSNEDIRIAKNEIYARHGRRFASTDLQSYFDQMAWYNGTVQPQNFDSGCLNAVEVANISFLDSEQQAGTGSDNKSVVEKEISLQKQEKEMYTAKINDRIGLSSFADTAVVKYNASDELTSYYAEVSAVQMGAFYEKNGEIFGNIGFDKSISYANEGSICAWYQNHEYRLVCENSVASEDYSQYEDTYVMYEDDRRLFEYKKMDEHISGGASPGYWLLTQDAIYVGNYDGLLVLDWNGTVLTQSDQYIYAFDVYENQVYMRTKDDHLACADVQTLANAHEIRYAFDEESERSYEAAGNFIYQSYGALWCYDIGESDASDNMKVLDVDCDWGQLCTSDSYAYGISTTPVRDGVAIERISYLTGEKETACVIKNVGFAFLDHAQGSKLYLQLGPDKNDWTGQGRNFNMVTIAIDFWTGTVEVLAAGWYS